MEFRAKLLGLLPLGTGATVFVVFKDVYGTDKERLLAPLGVVGFVVTLGLLVYELRGIEDRTMLRARAKAIERSADVDIREGHFLCWRPGRLGIVDEIGAAWTVYLAVLATWAFVGIRGFERRFGWWPAWWKVSIVLAIVYCALLLALVAYDYWIYDGPELRRKTVCL